MNSEPIQLPKHIFDIYTEMINGQSVNATPSDYFYKLKNTLCLLKPEDTKNIRSSFVSCMSNAIENRQMLCPQSNFCPMMDPDTVVEIADKRIRNYEKLENTPPKEKKPKKINPNKKEDNLDGYLVTKTLKPITDDEYMDVDPFDILNPMDSYFPEVIVAELKDRADMELSEDASEEELILAEKANAFLSLITRSYKAQTPAIAMGRLLDNAIKKIPEVSKKYNITPKF